ncbi:MAG: PEGA domain-containing protein, partial [Acidobacteriaceae bacterium]
AMFLPSLLIAQQSGKTAPPPEQGSPSAAQTAPAAPAASETSQATLPIPADTLLDGTPVKLRISQTISSADAKVGQEVPFEVIEEMDVNGVPVIAKGATAIGTVTEAQSKRSMGRAGKLDISISYVRLRDEEKAALRAVKDTKGGGHVGAMTGAMVATSIVFFPAAPLFLFMHGKDISIPQGTEITAFVQGDMHLDMARFAGSGQAPGASAASINTAPAISSLVISSTPLGADIDIDGNFVGNTLSSISVASGSHQIVVKKKGFGDWSRTLNVTGGTINLNATLDPASQ